MLQKQHNIANERGQDMTRKGGNFPNLNAELARIGMSNEKLGEIIGANTASVHRKLYGITEFKLCELVAIQEYLNKKSDNDLTLDYLFKKGVK